MHQSRIASTKSKLARVYGGGILAFAALVGGFTVFAVFLAHLSPA